MATRDDKTMRWVRLGSLGFVLALGWGFIGWQNHFHITPPLVFAMLGFLAVVLTTYNLWRTGAAAVAPNEEDDGDASWGKPTGARGELDREKRTMLKAIKEAEFDHAMGKLSKADADQMIGMYRARAIEVIKELEQLELGEAGTVRERILREVKARLAIEGKLAKDKKAAAGAADDDVAGPGMTVAADAEDVKRTEGAKAAEGVEAAADVKSADVKTADAKAADAKPASDVMTTDAAAVPPVLTAVDAEEASS